MIEINRYKLSNGLQIVHHSIPETKIVAVNILYRVGGKNDKPGKTGYAHLLEHLMFSGSENVPEFDKVLQSVGGENNAYTTADITNYYDVVSYQNVETAFWIESDRMANLKIDDKSLAVQRSVVAEEFKQRNLNRPYGDASAIFRKAAYKKHPYRIPVIGEKLSHIYNAKLEDIVSYYKQYYSPSNAILSVVGNISFDECIKLSKKWFEDIPASKIETAPIPVEPKQRKARLVEVERDVPSDMIYKLYHMSPRISKDYPCFDLLTDILSLGKSSRLHRELVINKKIFSIIDSAVTGDVEPGLLMIVGRVNPGVKIEDADRLLTNEISKLGYEDISEGELKKVLNKFESSYHFENMEVGDLAARLAYYEMLNSAEMINTQVSQYRNVTIKQLKKVAQKYLVPTNSTTLYYRAKNG